MCRPRDLAAAPQPCHATSSNGPAEPQLPKPIATRAVQRDPWAVLGRPQRSSLLWLVRGSHPGAVRRVAVSGSQAALVGSPLRNNPQLPSCQPPAFPPCPQEMKAVCSHSHCSCLACLKHLQSGPFLPVPALHKGCNSAPTGSNPIHKLTALAAGTPHSAANQALLGEADYLMPGLFISLTPHLLKTAWIKGLFNIGEFS